MEHEHKKKERKRPHTHRQISNVRTLDEAMKWRQTLVRDIQDRHSKVFDPLLGDDQLQQYNDQLNEWVKELKMWDWNITNKLHGRINHNDRLKTQLKNGKLILGKLYFGRAIELPEIKDHLDKQARKTFEIERLIDVKRVNLNNKKYTTTEEILIPKLTKFEEHWTPILQDINHIQHEDNKDLLQITPISLKEMETWLVERRKQKLLEQLDL